MLHFDSAPGAVATRRESDLPAPDADGPVVAVLCPSQWGIRNILHARVADRLVAQGVRPHLFVGLQDERLAALGPQAADDPARRAQVAAALADLGTTASGDELLALPLTGRTRGWATLDAVRRASYFRRHRLVAERVTAWWYRRHASRWERTRNAAAGVLALGGSRDPLFRWQTEALERLKRRHWDLRPIHHQYDRVRPALVVATSCVIWTEEPYLLAARERGIATLGCIQSFDNLTSRDYLPRCDDYAVWNRRMRDQVVAFYPEREASRVHVTGTPQFDFHVRPEFRWSRTETLARLGLAPDARYVLYAANSFHQTPSEPALVAELARRIEAAPALRERRLVVRLHPQDDFERWSAVARAPGVVLSRPSARSWSFAGPEDQALLVGSLAHADACCNMWSTISLDAAVVDTPVVCIAFAGARGTLEDRFCREAYAAEFYQPILRSGGVRLAADMDTVIAELVAYVADPARDREGRRRLATEEAGGSDGGSAARLADLIARLASAARPAAPGVTPVDR